MSPATGGDNPPIVWHNGRLCSAEEVRISPFDHGLLVGDGVFETLVVVRGAPFAIRRHLERLAYCCEVLQITPPPADDLRAALYAVVEANGLTTGRLRVTVTSGAGPLGSDRGDQPATALVVARPQAPWPDTTAVATVPWTRNEGGALAGLKTVSYAENVRALDMAHRAGASEAIFANTRGELCEGTGTNVFLAHEGRLVTPSLASGCLAGVTRALVIECTGAEEVDVPLGALAAAPEAFLSSTTRNVQPIREVDGVALPAAPGPHTAEAAQRFEDLMARDLDP